MTDEPPRTVDESGTNRDAELAQRLVSLADTLVDDYDVVDLLDRLVDASVELLHVAAAGLMLVDQRGNLQLLASSSEQIRLLELLQLQNDEGPCLDCVASGKPVLVPHTAAASGRWPRFTEAATSLGYTSVLALPMRLRSEMIGGLNLFSTQPPPLSESEQRIAQALADIATIGILQQRNIHRGSLVAEQLQTALNTRIVTEQAKGVLAQSGQLSMDRAYASLRSFARNSNRKLSEVAAAIARGELDPDAVLQERAPGSEPRMPTE